MSDQVLNPVLYNCLRARFGEVRIVNPGVEISWRLRQPADRTDGRPERKVIEPGESYFVACPFCHDWKQRLSVSYLFGTWDPGSRSRLLWLANCFNENCLSDFRRQEQLYLQIYGVPANRRDIHINPGRTVSDSENTKFELPGPCIPIEELATKQPRHPAVRYLQSRSLDPVKLGKMYGVSFCTESRYGLAADRIIIPFYDEHGELRGWQARHVGSDTALKASGAPKYFSAPGMRKKLVGYNLHNAVRHQTVIMCEGVTDCFSVGPQAFALLGKTVNPQLIGKLQQGIDRYWQDEAVVVVLLDPDPDPVSVSKGKPHHIVVATQALQEHLRRGLRERVLPVWLPAGHDPGDTDRDVIRRIIREAALRQALSVRFDRNSRKG